MNFYLVLSYPYSVPECKSIRHSVKMSAKECECYINSSEPSRGNHSHSNQHNPAAQNYFQNMWYNWWCQSARRTSVENGYATWCTTCVEEQRLREERVYKLTSRQANTSHITTDNFITNSLSPFNSHEMNGRSGDMDGNDINDRSQEMSDYEGSDNDDGFEMELNNDFKKFLEQSARHKEQRKKQKEEDLAKAQTDDYIEVNEIALEATTVPPTQQQGVLRTQEMKTLYGQSAHDIESLETSLQLHFNMNVDMRHPVFWPSIPLKF